MNIANVIGWKFNNQPGMKCKEVNGVMEIIDFPGGVPTGADQALWINEYTAWIDGGGLDDAASDIANIDPFLKALVLCLNDGSFVPGSNYNLSQIKASIKAKL